MLSPITFHSEVYEIDCLIPLPHSKMRFSNTLSPPPRTAPNLLTAISIFFFLPPGDCRRSYEDDDSLHTRNDAFSSLFSRFLSYFFLLSSFLWLCYCTVWRWWLAPELAVMKWIYIYHAGAGGVEGKAE